MRNDFRLMDVSLVIPTFNREELLRKTVPQLAEQLAGDFSYEVIFVINGSTDGSEAVLREANLRWPDKIRYFVIAPSGSPAAPRNTGIRAAKGSAVIIMDDDVIPDPHLVYHHAKFHQLHPEPYFAALGRLTIPEDSLDDPESFFHEFIDYGRFYGAERLHFLDFWTCNVSVKRQFMLDHGMFDESLAYFEDGLCGYRLSRHGMQLCFVPEASGVHVHHMDLSPTAIAKKGALIGRTLYTFEQLVPGAELRVRYGILSRELSARTYILRAMKRVLLFSLSNRLFMAALKRVAVPSRNRSRLTDLYYYLVFRRSILVAYGQAKRSRTATS
jgi:glycosyltransferase involved in cell wall biosynthesis